MIQRRLIFILFVVTFLYFFVGGIFSYNWVNSFEFKFADITYLINVWATAGYSLLALFVFVLAYFTMSKVRFSFAAETIVTHVRPVRLSWLRSAQSL